MQRFVPIEALSKGRLSVTRSTILGVALPSRVRKALVSLRSARGRIVEDGRDIIKVHGLWVYLYKAVDKAGQTVDFLLGRSWDVSAAKSFLRSAMKNTQVPTNITLDAYAASHRAVREMKEDGELPGSVKVQIQAIRQRGRNDLRNRAGREDPSGSSRLWNAALAA